MKIWIDSCVSKHCNANRVFPVLQRVNKIVHVGAKQVSVSDKHDSPTAE